jgi:hypothetical protein
MSVVGIAYVVIGGVAGAAHGSVRVTDDLDICYQTSEDNRSRLAVLLVGWQAYLRGVEAGLPFILDERTPRDSGALTLVTSQGNLGLFQRVFGVGSYENCRLRSEQVVVGDVRFDALDLPASIDAKRARGRGKDIEHLRELEALLELRREIEREDRLSLAISGQSGQIAEARKKQGGPRWSAGSWKMPKTSSAGWCAERWPVSHSASHGAGATPSW